MTAQLHLTITKTNGELLTLDSSNVNHVLAFRSAYEGDIAACSLTVSVVDADVPDVLALLVD